VMCNRQTKFDIITFKFTNGK